MKGNKVFLISDLAFILPEDFNGDVFDALKEVIKYHETPKASINHEDVPTDNVYNGEGLDYILSHEDLKLHIDSGLFENKNGTWKNLHKLEGEEVTW